MWSEAGTPLHTASAMPQFRSSKAMGDRWRERMTRTSVRAATKNPLPKNQPHSHYGASAERASPDPPILSSSPGFAFGGDRRRVPPLRRRFGVRDDQHGHVTLCQQSHHCRGRPADDHCISSEIVREEECVVDFVAEERYRMDLARHVESCCLVAETAGGGVDRSPALSAS